MRKCIKMLLFSLLLTILAVSGMGGIKAEAKDYIGTKEDEEVNICDLQVGDTVQNITVKNLGDDIVYYQTDPEYNPEQMANDGRTSFSNSDRLYLVAIETYEAEDGEQYPLYVFNTENKRTYGITVTQGDDSGGCSAYVENSKAAPGEKVTLTVITTKGYEFKGWEVIKGNITIGKDNTFVMPAGNVEIKALFERSDNTEYTVTVNAVGRGAATVTSYDSEEISTPSNTMGAKVGDRFWFDYEPEKGYCFLGWEIVEGDISIVSGHFAIMPAENVVINAVFSDGTQKHVDINGMEVGDVLKAWDGISDGGLDEYGDYDGDFYVQLDNGSPHHCWSYDGTYGVSLESQKNMFMGVYGFYYRVNTYLAEVTTITPGESESGETYTLYKFKTCAGVDAGVVEKGASEGTAAENVLLSSKPDELKKAVLTSEDKLQVQEGKDIAIWLNVDDMSKTVSDQDKAKVMSVLPQGSEVGMYLDIELFKQVAGKQSVSVKELNSKISIGVKVPETLLNSDASKVRTYQVVRVHDGKAEILNGVFDKGTGIFTFETDRFSTYALIYHDEDAKNSPEDKVDDSKGNTAGTTGGKTNAVKTGDNSMVFLWVLLMAGGAALILYMKKRMA